MNGMDQLPAGATALLDKLCEGELAPSEAANLERLICAEPAVCRLYLRYVDLHVELRRRYGRAAGQVADIWPAGERENDEAGMMNDELESPESPLHPSSFILHPSSSALSPLSVGGPVFSYMVATIILGLMLFGAWAYKITHDHRDYVENSRGQTTPGSFADKTPEPVFVGRITGMKECRWSDPRTATNLGALVPLDRKYALASGLMEITYRTGAKVILEGPCDYAVESDAGGFLAQGKLTARVDVAKPQAGKTQDHNPQIPNQQISSSLIPHPSSLFFVRTPTAIVTDLGTEFGVEVRENGDTTSQVFRGAVKVRIVGSDSGQPVQGTVLRENESVRVELGKNQAYTIRRVAISPDLFTCRMPEAPPVLFLRDTFDNQTQSNIYGSVDGYGLNQELSNRQSGLYSTVNYVSGGNLSVQVDHAICRGKLCLFTDPGQAGWLALNRYFPHNVEVSVELEPEALRCADKSPVPKTVQGDLTGESWMALGVCGRGFSFDHGELPLASDAGAVLQLRANGRWGFFENGERIAEGRVPPARPYRVVMCLLGDKLEIRINDVALDLDSNDVGMAHKLTGRLAETRNNVISLGACNMDTESQPNGPMLNSTDNLVIRGVCPNTLKTATDK